MELRLEVAGRLAALATIVPALSGVPLPLVAVLNVRLLPGMAMLARAR